MNPMLHHFFKPDDYIQFIELYKRGPCKDNVGGLKEIKSFYLWFMLTVLRPAVVIESGVWRGCSTWLIENATNAKIYCLDPNVDNVSFYTYRSPRAIYSKTDFLSYSFSDLTDSLLILDDHQDACPRLRKCLNIGIKHIILDDDYISHSMERDHISFGMAERFQPYEIVELQEAIVSKYRFPKTLKTGYEILDNSTENVHRDFVYLELK